MAFWRLYYHLVWATKNREPLIQPDFEARLYAYLVHKAAELGVYVYAVNGCCNHLHLIVAIPPQHAIADVVKRLKGASSHDLNIGNRPDQFAWQRGYGALSLGERQLPDAVAYVQNQKAHHAQQVTNAWLERCAELDEGPLAIGQASESAPSRLRDRPATYQAWEDLPF